MALNMVDLPAPLEPMIVTKSPLSRWRDRAEMAFLALTVPGLKVLEMFLSLACYLPPFRAAAFRFSNRIQFFMVGNAMARATMTAVMSRRPWTGIILVYSTMA